MSTGELQPSGQLAAQLVDEMVPVLLKGDEDTAYQVLKKALAGGLDPPSIYLRVFQPALDQIGDLWQAGRVSVAEEHKGTCVVRWLMAALWFEFNPDGYRSGYPSMLAACAQGERHDIGLTMVGDFLRRDGWHVVMLGADVPEDSLVQMAYHLQPGVFLLSAAMAVSLDSLRTTIPRLRDAVPDTSVLVGGRVFRLDRAAAHAVGADRAAPDAADAVVQVRQLMAG